MKHLPFDSIYRPDFEVVEQRQGKTTFFPHTDQLPALLRAINLEFYGALPPRLARTDHRASDYQKLTLKLAAILFAGGRNAHRTDGLRLFFLADRQLVAKVSIVQQITRETRQGPLHHFRFYAGPDLFPECYLNGKRVAFCEHALQRFTSRVPHPVGADLSDFLAFFFGGMIIILPVGPGYAFVIPYFESLLALPFKETEREFIVTTCLTINEINSMRREMPPRACNLHFDLPFTVPRVRHWSPIAQMQKLYQTYSRKIPLPMPPPQDTSSASRWYCIASRIPDFVKSQGHGPQSRLVFLDNVFGPTIMDVKPREVALDYDELAEIKKVFPQQDWDAIFASRLKLTGEAAEKYFASAPEPMRTAA